MNVHYAEIVADTGLALFPLGALVRIEIFHHVPFVSPTPTVTVRLDGDTAGAEIPTSCIRLLEPVEVKRIRAEHKRARRAAGLSARES